MLKLGLLDLANGHDPAIVANLLGGVTGFVLVFAILGCACLLRKSATRITEPGDGYQDIRETDQRAHIGRPFKKGRKATANGVAHFSQSNSRPVGDNPSGSQSRFYQFPAAPLPVLPPSSSTLSASVIGVGRGNLTRESSTSELYASVDRNPAVVGNERRRQSSESRDDGGNENAEEHTYSKIRPPPGTYDEIDDARVASAKPPGRSFGANKNSDADPFYSRVNEFRAGKSGATIPPPVPRPPMKRASHPYDYPKFLSQNGRERWQDLDASDASTSRKPPFLDGDTTPGASGDAVYSKIESQYGGSEDPYSSIKGSEEHYSCILPNRASNGSSGDENASVKASTSAKPPALHGRTGTVPAYGSIRPRAIRFVQPRRSRSDGEEYSIIRKPISHKSGQNDALDYDRRAPPIPEKRFSTDPSWHRTTGQYESISPASTSAAIGHGRPVNAVSPAPSFVPSYAPSQVQSEGADNGAKREPSYRFITVRESLDALRARMEAAAVTAVATASTPVASAHSDSSLHYYATISEHSYEVVPSRRGSERNGQRGGPDFACRTVSYIDDDEYELGTAVDMELLATSDLSPTSNTVDESNTSSNTLLNVSVHSQTGSHATSTGSHVTLVHVGGLQNNPTATRAIQEPENGIAQVHLRRSHPRTALVNERRKARVCRMASSDDSSGSIGAALSIDVESSFGVDENLSMADQRDFNPSTAGEMRSDYSLDALDDTLARGLYRTSPRRPNAASVPSQPSSGKSPEIVALETLKNFNVSSSNSLNEDDVQARVKDSGTVSYQL